MDKTRMLLGALLAALAIRSSAGDAKPAIRWGLRRLEVSLNSSGVPTVA